MIEKWPPESIEAAEEESLDLSTDIDMITAQLADKDRTHEDGSRFTEHEYHQWRYRAVFALKAKTARRRRLKAWIKAANIEAARIEAGVQRPGNVVELLGCLMRVIRQYDDLTPREKALLTLAQRWIQTQGAPLIVKAKEAALSASA